MKKEYLNQFPTIQIIDELPENYPLYKDGGLWQVRTYDFEDVIYSQSVDQSFDDFVKGYAFKLLNGEFGNTSKEVLLTNLAAKQTLGVDDWINASENIQHHG